MIGSFQPPPPPPSILIYAMVHVYMLCIYVGKTALRLLQRLRKHGTTTSACAEDSSFHDLLRTTGLSEWTRVPPQFTVDKRLACFLERDWRFRLQRWAVNDCAPTVRVDDVSPVPPPQDNKHIHTLTRPLHKTVTMRVNQPFPRSYSYRRCGFRSPYYVQLRYVSHTSLLHKHLFLPKLSHGWFNPCLCHVCSVRQYGPASLLFVLSPSLFGVLLKYTVTNLP